MKTAARGGGGGGGVWYGMQVVAAVRNRRAGMRCLLREGKQRQSAEHARASPSSPPKLSCWQRGSVWPTAAASSVVSRFSAPLPSRRRGSAWTAASAATSRPARAHEGSGRVFISVRTLVLAAIPSPLPPALTKAAACSLSSVSATFRPINQAAPLHPAGPPAVTGRGWWHRVRLVRGGHDGGHRGKGRGSCHLYGSADPVAQDLACCAALVTRPYHVVGHSKRSLAFHQRLTAPSTSQRCGPAARSCMRE